MIDYGKQWAVGSGQWAKKWNSLRIAKVFENQSNYNEILRFHLTFNQITKEAPYKECLLLTDKLKT